MVGIMAQLHEGGWHLDRRVNVSIILTLVANIGMTFWWASSTTTRLAAVEHKLEQAAPQADRLTKVETRLEAVQEGISEIKQLLRPPPRSFLPQ